MFENVKRSAYSMLIVNFGAFAKSEVWFSVFSLTVFGFTVLCFTVLGFSYGFFVLGFVSQHIVNFLGLIFLVLKQSTVYPYPNHNHNSYPNRNMQLWDL
jgi:hypothetical protein